MEGEGWREGVRGKRERGEEIQRGDGECERGRRRV